LLLSTTTAHAEPTFPAVVDTFLKQPGWVEGLFADSSPPGCHLCHVNGALGGLPLKRFGAALNLQSTAPSDGQLQAALTALAAADPRAISDLEMGKDPNADQEALSGDPLVQYGCASITPGRTEAAGGAALLVTLALAAHARRLRSKSTFHRS
jgi:hypothetical protein